MLFTRTSFCRPAAGWQSLFILAGLTAAPAALAQAPAGYDGFRLYTRAGGTSVPAVFNMNTDGSGIADGPQINNSRVVAVRTQRSVPDGFGGFNTLDVAWVGDGTANGTRRSSLSTISNISINNTGLTTFTDSASPAGIYRYSFATPSTAPTLLTNGPLGASSWSGVRVNNNNQVGYRATVASVQSYYSYDIAGNSFITHETGNTNFISAQMSTPTFNDNRQIAAVVRANGTTLASQQEIRVFNSNGTSTRLAAMVGADASSPFASLVISSIGFNNSGSVAFAANRTTTAGGGAGIFVTNGTTTTTIALTGAASGIASIDAFAPSLNNNGLVAFRGKGTDNRFSIWVGDGSFLLRLVSAGTRDLTGTTTFIETGGLARFGSGTGTNPTSSPFSGAPSINDAGDVAFTSSLLNNANPAQSWGRGVFVATVPAPGSAALLGLAGLVAARRRRN